MFSKTCEYGIKSIIYIAKKSLEGLSVKIDEISENAQTPRAFTRRIMSILASHQLIESFTGPSGGFKMDLKKMKQTTIGHVVVALDGDDLYYKCVLGLNECNSKAPCPMHKDYVNVRAAFKKMVDQTSIYDLAVDLANGKAILPA